MMRFTITRRQFTGGASAFAAATVLAGSLKAQQPSTNEQVRRLTAKLGEAELLETDAPRTPIWGYEGHVPGPELRVAQGKPVAIDLVNSLPQPTTIHWHGIRIDNSMDGVAGLTQTPVTPGETFAYRFSPPDAGTYWYHPHNRTWEQLARGLYGPFIVEEQQPPPCDQDLVLMIDDWRLGDNGHIDEASLGSMHDISHAGRLGNVLTLNGRGEQDIPVRAGQRLRLRLINAANARIIGITFEGHVPMVIALDGQPLDRPFAPGNNLVRLAPAQRADLILDCDQDVGAQTSILADTGREKLRIGRFVYHKEKRERPNILTDIPLLPQNPMPVALDLDRAINVDLEMTGGAMSAFEAAEYKGKRYGARELVREHHKIWAFNGIVGMPQSPLMQIPLGKTVKVRIVNRTAWPHAMHFHGHHVKEVAHARRTPLPYWRDTILMERGEEVTVAFLAHNPGRWMLHCHMLEHQAGGMSSWYEVA
ncbi:MULTISPECIES: multicopper oxidase family protein [Filomicrobium]|nr:MULTISPECIES: multicopper oxidase family protein [Filomicrobium]MCV0370010.1 multicopper oxidase family protein [Filomicrobium sp.]